MDIVKVFIESILYPAMEVKNGNRTRRYTKELIETQSYNSGELHSLQREKLIKLLNNCLHNVPAYKDIPLTSSEIEHDPYAALEKFPLLSKREFIKDPDIYLSTTANKAGLIPNATGGSTGEPVKFYMDRYDVEHYEAARWRGLSWAGITPGSRSIMIWGNPIELDAQKQKKVYFKDKWLKNRIVISAYTLSPSQIDEYLQVINRFKPEYIYGYASALYTFASMMNSNSKKVDINLKAVVSTAETLHDFQRDEIAQAFQCPVLNEYGARDAGILAYSCPENNMHISSENVIIEILDPITLMPCEANRSGLVATTDLNNLSMPRLRYLLGDLATLSDEKCQCGINLPLITSIDGRQDDMLQMPDGTLVHGNFVNQLTRKRKSIEKFQLIQKDANTAILNVVLNSEYDNDIDAFVYDINEIIPGVTVTVNIVDQIPAGKSGKFRYAIRDFDLNRSEVTVTPK